MDTMDPRIVARLAAAFAISNMGHEVPAYATEYPERWSTSSRSEVDGLAGHLMETDDHEKIFADEARMWEKMIRKDGANYFRETFTHPWVAKILDAEFPEK